ncbi:hypothetical protein YIM_32740 [Amycolatopsis sp. YIM 10]|nr:hypothetical protein YIM_32740 [Amycolatopsis sp. YIM 10]
MMLDMTEGGRNHIEHLRMGLRDDDSPRGRTSR